MIRLFSVLRINGRNDSKPFTEEWFRRRIEQTTVTVARNGRPLWRSLLSVIFENKRVMTELGVSYDVQTTIAAILKVIRDIPRSNNPLFGQSFSARIEEMDKRMLDVPYDERTKDTHDESANSQLFAMRTISSSFAAGEPMSRTLKMHMIGPKISFCAMSALSGTSHSTVGG